MSLVSRQRGTVVYVFKGKTSTLACFCHLFVSVFTRLNKMTRVNGLLTGVPMFNIEFKHFYTNKTSYYTGHCIASDILTFLTSDFGIGFIHTLFPAKKIVQLHKYKILPP